MLTRRVSRELLAWKNADRKKCLIVQGARQVGKTFIIEDFARRILYISFVTHYSQRVHACMH